MSSDDHGHNGQASSASAWMKTVTDLWQSAIRMWPDLTNILQGSGDSQQAEGPERNNRIHGTWQRPLNLLQVLLTTLTDPEALNACFAGTGVYPDVLFRLCRSGCDGSLQLYQEWLAKISKFGQFGEDYRLGNVDKNVFKGWMEIYQQEIQPILNAPQLGLTRVYQERMSQAIDKYHLYQAAIGEFISLLNLPIEESLQIMEKKLQQLKIEGKLSDNYKDYYNMWIKLLEGHYMTLFRSSDYLHAMTRTLNTLEEFKMAQHKMLADILQVLPIPTNKDMDELYKDLYLLKNTVKVLSKKVEMLESST